MTFPDATELKPPQKRESQCKHMGILGLPFPVVAIAITSITPNGEQIKPVIVITFLGLFIVMLMLWVGFFIVEELLIEILDKKLATTQSPEHSGEGK